ncbi:MAG: hypothetical protein ACM357_04485, partial [Gemmatimonadota bacterium]
MTGMPANQGPVGRVVATELKPSTPHQFYFWTARESAVGIGAIAYRPNIERLEGTRVRFVDGTVEDVDVIVWCTGYKVTFPFFDPGFVS